MTTVEETIRKVVTEAKPEDKKWEIQVRAMTWKQVLGIYVQIVQIDATLAVQERRNQSRRES
jgi:hypothetical protein